MRGSTWPSIALGLILFLPLVGTAAQVTSAPALASDVPAGLPVHASILIEGDGAFLDPANGVSGGTGTPEDPYRIASMILLQDRGFGIRLANTTAHVVLEHLVIGGGESPVGRSRECPALFNCPKTHAIHLRNARNVHVRDVEVFLQPGTGGALTIEDSSAVLVERVGLGLPVAHPYNPVWELTDGLTILRSRDVLLRELVVLNADYPYRIEASEDVRVERSRFDGSNSGFRNGYVTPPSHNITFTDTAFSGVSLFTTGILRNLTLVGNTFTGPSYGIYAFPVIHLEQDRRGFFICGNTFDSKRYRDFFALFIWEAAEVTLVGNRFLGNDQGAMLMAIDDLNVSRNLFRDSRGRGLDVRSEGAVVRENAFVNNRNGVFAGDEIDLTRNWWGDARGPSGEGRESTGDPLEIAGSGVVTYEPWLTEAPDLEVDCSSARGGSGKPFLQGPRHTRAE